MVGGGNLPIVLIITGDDNEQDTDNFERPGGGRDALEL